MRKILAHCILFREPESVGCYFQTSFQHFPLKDYQPKINTRFWFVDLAEVDALVAISTGNALLILLKVGILLKGPNVPSLPTTGSGSIILVLSRFIHL